MEHDNDTSPAPNETPPPGTRRRREPPTIDLAADVVSEAAGGEPPPEPPTADEAAPPRPARTGLVAALAGAGAALAVLGAAWLAGWPMAAPEAPAPVAASPAAVESLAARLSTLEADFRTAAALPQAAAPDTADLAPRLQALERAQAALHEEFAAEKAAGGQRAAGLDAIRDELAALKAAPRDAVPSPDLGALEARLAAVAAKADAAANAAADAATRRSAAVDDRPLRRALVAMQLDIAVRRGEPFADLLAAAASFEGDAAKLAPLRAFAAGGVPAAATLAAELEALLPAPTPPAAAPAAPAGGWLDRLQASAARLVQIRREAPAGEEDRATAAARAVAAARRGDLAGARREVMSLPPDARGAASAWMDRTEARDAALAAARAHAAAAAAALAKPAP